MVELLVERQIILNAIFTQTQSGNDYIVFKVDSDKAIKMVLLDQPQ